MRAHDTASKEGDALESAMPSLNTITNTTNTSDSPAAFEKDFAHSHNFQTVTNPPLTNHHDSYSQTRLLISNGLFDQPQGGNIDFDNFLQAPAWLADEHFDLNALNSSVMESSLGLFSPPQTAYESSTDATLLIPTGTSLVHKEDQVRQHWFNYVGTHSSGYVTPEAGTENGELDERYRQNLSQRLQQRVPTEPLPSTEFLVSVKI